VQHAHEQGVLHRDLKPANILLGDDGRPLVTDFGLAKLLDDGSSPKPAAAAGAAEDTAAGAGDVSVPLTATGLQPGTPVYMAPEQHDPAFGAVGRATDVWALGVILYELLTGTRPFVGRTRAEVRARVCAGQFTPPHRLRPGADRRLAAVAGRCLETDPARRYATAGQLADALAAWRTRRRWPRGVVLGVLGAGIAALVAALLLREPSAEEKYRRETAAAVAALKQGKPATFIAPGASAAPPYRVRAGEGATIVGRTEDGLTIDGRARCCLVELCPEVPLPRYQVRATIELKNWMPDGHWGVYVNHTPLSTPGGTQHSFEAACFLDRAGGWPVVEATVAPRLFSYNHPTPQYPYRDEYYKVGEPARAPVPEGAGDTRWRTLRLEVRGDNVTAYCGGGGLAGELLLGTVGPVEREHFRFALLRHPDLRDISLETNGTGAGVYVDSCCCVLKEFVIEALAAP
jgi:hypothetical protein